jgi:hypothetical protein
VPEPLPADSTGLTPAWLTTALSARHPGVRVAAVEVLDATERTNHHLRLGLAYEMRAGAPDTLFCRLPPRDPAHRARIGAGGMGAREVHVYDDVRTGAVAARRDRPLRRPAGRGLPRDRRAPGGCPIAFEDAWLARRIHAADGVITSSLSPVPPSNRGARRLFTSRLRARAIAASEGLDGVGASREAGRAAGAPAA